MEKETDFARHLTSFFNSYLPMERGVSRHTLRSYAHTFTLFIDFMREVKNIRAEKLELKTIDRNVVVDFLEWLQTKRQCSDNTRNLRLAALRSFFRYLQYEDVRNIGKWQQIMNVKAKRKESVTFTSLSIEGMKTLLSQIPTETREGLRHLAMLALLYDSGARVQELIDLTPADLNLDTPAQVKLLGKGRKARIVPIQDNQVRILKKYIAEYRLDLPGREKHPLFTNNRGGKLSNSGIAHIISMYAADVRAKHPGLIPDRISPHSFRHSKAMHLLYAGLKLVYIRDILGHVSIKTTELYARVDSQQKREALEKAYQDITPDRPDKGEWERNSELKEWLKTFSKKL